MSYNKKSRSKSKSNRRRNISRLKNKKNILPKLNPDDSLSDFGYKLSMSQANRRRAMRRAVRKNGALPVMRRLNLIRNYSKSHKKNYERLSEDVEFMKRLYARKKSKSKSKSKK